MLIPKLIVLATDLSEASLPAAELAGQWAAQFGAKLVLAHVFDPTPMVPPIALPSAQTMEARIEAEMIASIQSALDKLRKEKLAQVKEVEVAMLKHPNPAFAICEESEKRGADLLVIGTHGRTGIAHFLIGSVAERIVRKSPCPVLTVPPPRSAE